MNSDQTDISFEDVLARLRQFFPQNEPPYTMETVDAGIQVGDIFTRPEEMLPYIQTAFFDEKVVEIEVDGVQQVYFSRLYDHLPEPDEGSEDETSSPQPEYKSGSYLQEMKHLILLPAEPGMGNLRIRNSQQVLLRFFTSRTGVELGVFFENITSVHGLPVLRLSYPVIGRLLHKARAFRAKVPVNFGLQVIVAGKNKNPDLTCQPVDISVHGMSFLIQKEEQQLFRVGETRTLQLLLNGEPYNRLYGIVRHVSKIRSKQGTEFRCGVQLELSTRAMQSSIESLVATVQRAHLQELVSKSEKHNITFIH